MATIMFQTIPSFYATISEESLFISTKTYEKKTLFVKTTASPITTIRPVLYPLVYIRFYHWEKLRNCHINWIHFVSTINSWTVFIRCSYTDSAEKILQKGNVIDNVQRAIFFTQRNRGVDKIPSIAKMRLLRIKFKQQFMSALQKNKSTQTKGSVLAERIEKAGKTKFELELIKIEEYFPDGHGSYDINLVSFGIKPL